MAKKPKGPPVPPIFIRQTDSALFGHIRSVTNELYAAPHNIHPNHNPAIARRIDVQDFVDKMNAADAASAGSGLLAEYAADSLGMKSEDEIILELMKGWYQRKVKMKCRVHFYVRDHVKEKEIERWRDENA